MATKQFHPVLEDVDALDTFRLIHRVADIIYELLYSKQYLWMIDNRTAMVDTQEPCQTTRGAFLEFDQEAPWRFWTPWGDWKFNGGIAGDEDEWYELKRQLFTHIEVCEHKEGRSKDSSVYTLLAVEGKRLPTPKLVDPAQAVNQSLALSGWHALLSTC